MNRQRHRQDDPKAVQPRELLAGRLQTAGSAATQSTYRYSRRREMEFDHQPRGKATSAWLCAGACGCREETMSLDFDVFVVDPKPIPSAVPGFEEAVGPATWPPSTSTLISDDGSALLVDCLITIQEGQDLAAWVKAHGSELKYIYITHPHADHFLGLPEILTAFPEARPTALAESIPGMEEQISPGYMQIWGGFFPGQLTGKPLSPAPLADTTLCIGGSRATVIPVGTTDTGHSSVVHVSDLSLIVSGDVVYNQTHMWLAKSTPDSRAGWARALDAVAALEADTLIAGHRNPRAIDDDARRQIGESRRYLADFEVALERSSTPAELIDRMTAVYPDLANPYSLWFAAFDLLRTRT
ncbi:MBL fold metallo-hydrolase [Micromonospora sp. NPDC048999]|uniref:MBL fold metallo-hydrolase n=1 Tax=Micromonospora sp. NPDC048999 TaxID=3155391 RepID=UPI0033CBE927